MTEKNTILLEESFAPFFGDWWPMIRPFFIQGGFDPIYAFLKKESKRGKIILPESPNVFRCFRETSYKDLKIMFVGLSPYHTLKNGKPIADGLMLSCSLTNYLQPSLENWYNSCEKELFEGLSLTHVKNPDLSFLARQGVLLLNSGLTVEYLKPNSHGLLWEPFMKYFFEEIIGTMGVPIVFLGKEASKLKRYVMPFTWTFELSHPASAAYSESEWCSEGIFKNLNKLLKDRNNEAINWFELPDSPEPEIEEGDDGNEIIDNDLPF